MVYYVLPDCPKHLVGALEYTVNALPAAWLLLPQTGEIFDDIADTEQRLHRYCLTEGFDIGRTEGGIKKAPSARFQCSYHGKATKNWCKLEDHVEKNEEGNITSKCQREGTIVSQLDCQWSVRVTYKDIGKHSLGKKAFIITIICLNYMYNFLSNPLSFPRHRQALEEWQTLI